MARSGLKVKVKVMGQANAVGLTLIEDSLFSGVRINAEPSLEVAQKLDKNPLASCYVFTVSNFQPRLISLNVP